MELPSHRNAERQYQAQLEAYRNLGIDVSAIEALPPVYSRMLANRVLAIAFRPQVGSEFSQHVRNEVGEDLHIPAYSPDQFIISNGKVFIQADANLQLAQQLAENKFDKGELAKAVLRYPQVGTQIAMFVEIGLTTNDIFAYFRGIQFQAGREFFADHFAKAYETGYRRKITVQALDAAARRIYGKSGVAEISDKEDQQIVLDGSVRVLLDVLREEFSGRGIPFPKEYGGDERAAMQIESEFLAVQRKDQAAQFRESWARMKKAKVNISMLSVSICRDFPESAVKAMVTSAESLQKDLRQYYEQAIPNTGLPVEQQVSVGWIAAVGQVVALIEREAMESRWLINDGKARLALDELHREYTRIADLTLGQIKAGAMTLTEVSRIRFQEARILQELMKTCVKGIIGNFDKKIQEVFDMQTVAALTQLDAMGQDLGRVRQLRTIFSSENNLHVIESYEADKYFHGWELNQRGFVHLGNWRELKDGIPKDPTDEWRRKYPFGYR